MDVEWEGQQLLLMIACYYPRAVYFSNIQSTTKNIIHRLHEFTINYGFITQSYMYATH